MNPTHAPEGDKKRINVPETELNIEPLTAEEIQEDEDRSLSLINTELRRGFDFIKKYDKSVSIFGSARFKPDDEHSKQAEALSERIVKELGYAILTGGGPGIMQAANKGAYDAGGDSLGIAIKLPREQITNPYVKDEVSFYYFFTRKTILTFAAEAYIFFPGGFGTLDEFFEIITLIQTKKIPRVPVILVGRDFWGPLAAFIEQHVYSEHKAIDAKDMHLYMIMDDFDQILEVVKKAPVANWWKDFGLNGLN